MSDGHSDKGLLGNYGPKVEELGQACPVCGGHFGCTRMNRDINKWKIFCWSRGCVAIKFQPSPEVALENWNNIKLKS